jgi:hypothetical protein
MRVAVSLFCMLLTGLSGAQYQEDQTRDHEDQDSRYFERYAEEPEAEPSLDAFLERAEQLIRDRNYRAAASEHYRVQSDDPRLDADAAVELLDAFRDFFDEFWSGRMELADYDERSRIFLFYSFNKFNKMLQGDYRFNSIRPKGHYGSLFDVITMHTDAGCPAGLGNTLVHEAAHQLLDRRLFGDESYDSAPWLSEGLASYFGYTFQDASGAFRAGEVGGKRSPLLRDVPKRGCNEIKDAVKACKQALKESKKAGNSIVEELLTITPPASFYGSRARSNYAASWVLVHFLLHGDEGANADHFISYLKLTIRGGAGPHRLFELLGMSAAELDAALELHLKGMKVR